MEKLKSHMGKDVGMEVWLFFSVSHHIIYGALLRVKENAFKNYNKTAAINEDNLGIRVSGPVSCHS